MRESNSQSHLRLFAAVVSAATLLPSFARAESADPVEGFEGGARLGVEFPVGKIDSGSPFRGPSLSGVTPYRIPFWLDVGYRLSPAWWLGLGAQVGFGPYGDSCPEAAECEWTDVRIQAALQYHLFPQESADVWLSAALGWESLRGSITQKLEVPTGGSSQEVAVKIREVRGGPQLAVSAGVQFELQRGLSVGPYATAAGGMYLTDSFDCPAGIACDDAGADENRLHGWIGLGIRGTYGP